MTNSQHSILTVLYFPFSESTPEIITWLSNFKSIGKVFVIHGERDTTLNFADRITKCLAIPAQAPAINYTEILRFDAAEVAIIRHGDMCKGMNRDAAQAGHTDQ